MKNYNGKTLEEALQAAAADKNVAVEDLTYFVTEEKKGLLGIGSSVSVDAYCLDDVKEFLFDYLGNFFMGIDCDLEAAIEERNGEFIVMRGNQALEVDVTHEQIRESGFPTADAAEKPVAVRTAHGRDMDVGGSNIHKCLSFKFDDK